MNWVCCGSMAAMERRGAAEIARMKSGAILINTSRGPLIGEAVLVTALQERRIIAALDVFDQGTPEVDLSYFFTDHLAAELIAPRTRHEISASGTAIGHVDVGSTYVLPPTLTVQYHFMPHARLSSYAGAGLTVA